MTSVESNAVETVGDREVQSVDSDALEGYDMIEVVVEEVVVVVEEHVLVGEVVPLETMSASFVHLTGTFTFYSSEERCYWR